jgi:integrase
MVIEQCKVTKIKKAQYRVTLAFICPKGHEKGAKKIPKTQVVFTDIVSSDNWEKDTSLAEAWSQLIALHRQLVTANPTWKPSVPYTLKGRSGVFKGFSPFVSVREADLGKPLSHSTIAQRCSDLLHQAGLSEGTPHTIRHVAASHLFNMGVSVEDICTRARWLSFKTFKDKYLTLEHFDNKLSATVISKAYPLSRILRRPPTFSSAQDSQTTS